MGEAKLKKAVTENLEIGRVSMAIAKMCSATSTAHGADCYLHAALGSALLARLGVKCQIGMGYAAWRVGPGDGDVMVHHPSVMKGAFKLPGGSKGGEMFHAWIEFGGRIYDPSTYTIRKKFALLDAHDGMVTSVDWCPDYLFVPRSETVSLKRVYQEFAGLFYYERVPLLEARSRREADPLDPAVLSFAWMIYNNPDAAVIGPNDVL